MTQIHDFELDVRRHSDGSIDFDHYRSRAAALRGAALVANSPAPVIEASCRDCTRNLVPVDEPPTSTHIASFPRTSRAE
jgi:hypothetical protein